MALRRLARAVNHQLARVGFQVTRCPAPLPKKEPSPDHPGWALDLPDDPTTYHVGMSASAHRFQEAFGRVRETVGWCSSHVCLMQVAGLLPCSQPLRYLEIGVANGLSVLAFASGIRLYRNLRNQRMQTPLFEELVLADSWGNQYGGTGRESHAHVSDLLVSLNVDSTRVTFLDGDSKVTVPSHLRTRPAGRPFDAVYVDGDHSFEGARADLENVLPQVGQALFFDDMYHPAHCNSDRLLDLHRSLVERLQDDFYVFINRAWFGFAAFIRKSTLEAAGF
jgi:Methyltransferase domain